jgi:hypothetical protein
MALLASMGRMVIAAFVAAGAVMLLRPLSRLWIEGLPGLILPRAVDALGWLAIGTAMFLGMGLVLRLPEVGELMRFRPRRT